MIFEIPACPKCRAILLPLVRFAWPHAFTLWLCSGCGLTMLATGGEGNEPTEEFLRHSSFLVANGRLNL